MKTRKVILAKCLRKAYETDVRAGLAITPAQVLKMAEQGIPVTAQMNSALVDGHLGSDFNIALEERRGIDMATIWQNEMSSRKKIKGVPDSSFTVNS